MEAAVASGGKQRSSPSKSNEKSFCIFGANVRTNHTDRQTDSFVPKKYNFNKSVDTVKV